MSRSILFDNGSSWSAQGGYFGELIEQASTYLRADQNHIRDLMYYGDAIGWIAIKDYLDPGIRRDLAACLLSAAEHFKQQFQQDPSVNPITIASIEKLIDLCRVTLNKLPPAASEQ